jgi:hypothetical protein
VAFDNLERGDDWAVKKEDGKANKQRSRTAFKTHGAQAVMNVAAYADFATLESRRPNTAKIMSV